MAALLHSGVDNLTAFASFCSEIALGKCFWFDPLSSPLLSTIKALFRIHCPTIFSNCNPSFPTPTFSLCAREPTRPFSSPVFSSPILMCNGQRHSFYCLLCLKLVLLSLFSNLVFLPHKRLNNSI